MPVELRGGTTNHLLFDSQNKRVLKEFISGNGMIQSLSRRRLAEEWSMKHVLTAPQYLGSDDTYVAMSFVEGEPDIDGQIDQLPEKLQHQIYFESGKALASIHETIKEPLPTTYHAQHIAEIIQLIQTTRSVLTQNGISTMDLIDFMKSSYKRDLIEKVGLRWIHGDYWLRNVIGQLSNGLFKLSGVIDWETAQLNSPYADFAIVEMSIERAHNGLTESFWKGYGREPDRPLQRHYAIAKTMEWITGEGKQEDFTSDFYQTKFAMIRESIC